MPQETTQEWAAGTLEDTAQTQTASQPGNPGNPGNCHGNPQSGVQAEASPPCPVLVCIFESWNNKEQCFKTGQGFEEATPHGSWIHV